MVVTRIEQHALPAHVVAMAGSLAAAGGRVWLVGGAVRDLLLGERPRDFDLATDLLPAAVARALPDADARDALFGTIRVEREGDACTITTLRRESGYDDQRHPRDVVFVEDPRLDAPRRDFTVNALYVDLEDASIVDPTGGLGDLRARTLRVIGDPTARLSEDPLRLLRLVRLAAAHGLEVEERTARAAADAAAHVATVAKERVFDELTRAFTGPGRGRALGLFVEFGQAAILVPEVAAMAGVPQPPEYHPEGDVLTHVRLVLEHCPADDPVLAWSAVLHDVGKPPTFRVAADRIRFDGHDTLSAEMADGVLRRLAAPRVLRERVVDVCRHHIRFASLPAMRPRRAERWLREPGFEQHLAFHRADCLGSHGKLDIWQFARDALAALPPRREPLLGGADVLALGVPPGPEVGALLRAVDAQLDELPVPPTREHALVLLRDCVAQHRQGDPSRAR